MSQYNGQNEILFTVYEQRSLNSEHTLWAEKKYSGWAESSLCTVYTIHTSNKKVIQELANPYAVSLLHVGLYEQSRVDKENLHSFARANCSSSFEIWVLV